MINIRVCNGSGAIKEEPPLDFHQIVVWNGGAEGSRCIYVYDINHSCNQFLNWLPQNATGILHFNFDSPLTLRYKKEDHPFG